MKYIKNPRDAAVLRAAADKHGWKPRPSPDKTQTGNTVTGRGIAYAQRNGTTVAVVADVDVDRRGGKIWARKFTVAHDRGRNGPAFLRQSHLHSQVLHGSFHEHCA